MPIKWEQESTETLVARISGKLFRSEMQACQAAMTPIIQAHGNMRLLVILENFEGWAASHGWEDTSFADENDDYLSRFAFVGDEKWRDQALMFALAGLRPVEIQYFSSDQETAARKWLTSE